MSDITFTLDDPHVASLRTFLTKGPEVWIDRHLSEMKDSDSRQLLLFSAAFTRAAQRRFSPTYSVPQLIRYVADLRLQFGDAADELNPKVAENLLRYALGDKTLNEDPPFGVSQQRLVSNEVNLLMVLYAEMALDEEDAEELIKNSVELANHWLSTGNGPQEK